MTIAVSLRPVPDEGTPPKAGDTLSRVTDDNVDAARLLQLAVTDAEEREFLRQVRVDDIAALYQDRDQNWADFRVRGVPDSIADDAATVSLWVLPLVHGAGLDLSGACKVGFSRAPRTPADDSDFAAAPE